VYSVRDLVDVANGPLFETVNRRAAIHLRPSETSGWGQRLEDDAVIIDVSPSKYPQACFAHELLHAQLELDGMKKPHFTPHTSLSGDLVSYIYNQLAHHRMYISFLGMGYPPVQFLNDDDVKDVYRLLSRDMPTVEKAWRRGGRKPLRGLIVALPYLVVRSPHVQGEPIPPRAKTIFDRADGGFLRDIDSLLEDWVGSAHPDVPRAFARFFKVCGVLDVGFAESPGGMNMVYSSSV
jgi:hypothetical protein